MIAIKAQTKLVILIGSFLVFLSFLSPGNVLAQSESIKNYDVDIFGRKSAKRTLLGVEKYSEAASLLNFLKSQDEQLNFQSKNKMFFEKLLPYAAGFGVEKVWAERFKDISVQKPDWYEGDNFSNILFIGALTSNISGSVKSSMSPTRSSSGFSSGFSSGSSGGGGGGGGGGSW